MERKLWHDIVISESAEQSNKQVSFEKILANINWESLQRQQKCTAQTHSLLPNHHKRLLFRFLNQQNRAINSNHLKNSWQTIIGKRVLRKQKYYNKNILSVNFWSCWQNSQESPGSYGKTTILHICVVIHSFR